MSSLQADHRYPCSGNVLSRGLHSPALKSPGDSRPNGFTEVTPEASADEGVSPMQERTWLDPRHANNDRSQMMACPGPSIQKCVRGGRIINRCVLWPEPVQRQGTQCRTSAHGGVRHSARTKRSCLSASTLGSRRIQTLPAGPKEGCGRTPDRWRDIRSFSRATADPIEQDSPSPCDTEGSHWDRFFAPPAGAHRQRRNSGVA